MKSKKILIYGEVLFDHFEDGTKHLGGAPFNVAWHLTGFGADPLLITAIGNDEDGKEITDLMNSWGMRLDGVTTLNKYPTGRVDIILEDGEPTYSIKTDCAYDNILIPKANILNGTDFLYFGSLALRTKVSRDSLVKLKESFKGITFIDINIRHPWFNLNEIIPLIKCCSWLKINIDELNELSGRAVGLDSDEILPTLKDFSGLHEIENIILTAGEAGAYIYQSSTNSLYFQAVKKIPALVSAVGAGDSFSATTIYGIIKGWEPEKLLERATLFASEVCKIKGAISTNREFYNTVKEI